MPVLYYPLVQNGEDRGLHFMVCLSVHSSWGQNGNKAEKGEFLLFSISVSMKSKTSVNWLHLTPT